MRGRCFAEMRTLTRRLEKLEKTLAPLVVNKTDDAADLRASIRHSAKDIGQPLAAQLEELLDEIGPYQFQLELHRAYLLAHGFVQDPVRESLAGTTCRAAGIRPEELRARMSEGRSGMEYVYEQIRLRGVQNRSEGAPAFPADNHS